MKFTAIIAPLLALVPVCTANFDIYMNNAWTVQGGSTGWTIFEADPPCGQVNNAIIYGNYGDVSGSYIGVRCVGDCFPSNRPDGIQVLEMHFNNNPLYHWSKFIVPQRVRMTRQDEIRRLTVSFSISDLQGPRLQDVRPGRQSLRRMHPVPRPQLPLRRFRHHRGLPQVQMPDAVHCPPDHRQKLDFRFEDE